MPPFGMEALERTSSARFLPVPLAQQRGVGAVDRRVSNAERAALRQRDRELGVDLLIATGAESLVAAAGSDSDERERRERYDQLGRAEARRRLVRIAAPGTKNDRARRPANGADPARVEPSGDGQQDQCRRQHCHPGDDCQDMPGERQTDESPRENAANGNTPRRVGEDENAGRGDGADHVGATQPHFLSAHDAA
ncbi:MAG TPA: hypothetical protein VJQ49_06295 [Casimicrobiaceae bacterium]|nr:hypothetical protein [Casimicrobiaceae bacterium]